eukprot:1270840-Karenia_brevis.AAC.1
MFLDKQQLNSEEACALTPKAVACQGKDDEGFNSQELANIGESAALEAQQTPFELAPKRQLWCDSCQ